MVGRKRLNYSIRKELGTNRYTFTVFEMISNLQKGYKYSTKNFVPAHESNLPK